MLRVCFVWVPQTDSQLPLHCYSSHLFHYPKVYSGLLFSVEQIDVSETKPYIKCVPWKIYRLVPTVTANQPYWLCITHTTSSFQKSRFLTLTEFGETLFREVSRRLSADVQRLTAGLKDNWLSGMCLEHERLFEANRTVFLFWGWGGGRRLCSMRDSRLRSDSDS